jgi:hypothetical protein
MINTILNPPEVEVEPPDRVRLLTTRLLCLNIWVNDQTTKVILKVRMINQKRSDPTITHTKIMVFLRLKRTLLLTLEIKDKYDLEGVNDPDENKISMKSRKMCSVRKVRVKDKVRNDKRTRCPHLPRKFKWNQKNNK